MSCRLGVFAAPLLSVAAWGQCDPADLFHDGVVPTVAHPIAAVVDDVNDDGIADLITIGQSAPALAVHFGLGAGRFDSAVLTPVPGAPIAAHALDANEDGHVDLAVLDAANAVIRIMHGSGDGTFVVSNSVPLLGDPRVLRVGDLNADGHADLVVGAWPTGRDDGGVFTWLGDGTGVFVAGPTLASAERVNDFALGDLNRDGVPDATYTLDDPDTLVTALGDGLGGFTVLQSTDEDTFVGPLALADVTDDGVLDLAISVGNDHLGGILIVPGVGDGHFDFDQESYTRTFIAVRGIALGDVTGDGAPDIVARSGVDEISELGRVAVVANLGGGAFPLDGTITRTTRGGVSAFVLEDINGDAVRDVTVAAAERDALQSLAGPQTADALPFLLDEVVSRLAVGDFDGDGLPDLMLDSITDGSLVIRRGLGDGRFEWWQTVEQPAAFGNVYALDLNDDGVDDLLLNRFGAPPAIEMWLNDGTGQFEESVSTPVSHGVIDLLVGDVSGDGRADLVCVGATDLSVLRRIPDGGFVVIQEIELPVTASRGAVTDVNGDGALDVIVVRHNQEKHHVRLLNDGSGVLAAPVVSLVPEYIRAMASFDADADGRSDLLLAYTRHAGLVGGTLRLLLGQADGSFVDGGSIDSGDTPVALHIDDVNHDGWPDILARNHYPAEMWLHAGRSDGTFESPVIIHLEGYEAYNSVVADFDGDGSLDLGRLLRMFSDFKDMYRYGVIFNHCAVCPADLNGDQNVGMSDLVFVLAAWGPCAGCAADLDLDGAVTFADMLLVLSAWGPCAATGE